MLWDNTGQGGPFFQSLGDPGPKKDPLKKRRVLFRRNNGFLFSEKILGLVQEIIHSAFASKRFQHPLHARRNLAFEELTDSFDDSFNFVIIKTKSGKFFL